MTKINTVLKIPKQIYASMLEDLNRPHPFALERVGLMFTTSKLVNKDCLLVLVKDYLPVEDLDYIKDDTVGAKINANAIRKAMQRIYDKKEGCFHVHLHIQRGNPSPGSTDKESLKNVIDSFLNISREQACGYLILSKDSFYAEVKSVHSNKSCVPSKIEVIGYPMKIVIPKAMKPALNEVFSRQSFLGASSQHYFENIHIGVIGYGGGGSHIGQQLAHLGVKHITIFDFDKVEKSNLNRLIGAGFDDTVVHVLKTKVAKRTILKILPTAKVCCVNSRWQNFPELLQTCDIVFGCVDSYSERQQLEAECRRYLMPYIDIGMDVYQAEDKKNYMSGQVILSMPGHPCMSCFGFLNEEKLGLEAAKYGNVGGRPQVVWPNGILASTAIGIFVDLITGWTGMQDRIVYLSYDGNTGCVQDHPRAKYCDEYCSHFKFDNLGIPNFKSI